MRREEYFHTWCDGYNDFTRIWMREEEHDLVYLLSWSLLHFESTFYESSFQQNRFIFERCKRKVIRFKESYKCLRWVCKWKGIRRRIVWVSSSEKMFQWCKNTRKISPLIYFLTAWEISILEFLCFVEMELEIISFLITYFPPLEFYTIISFIYSWLGFIFWWEKGKERKCGTRIWAIFSPLLICPSVVWVLLLLHEKWWIIFEEHTYDSRIIWVEITWKCREEDRINSIITWIIICFWRRMWWCWWWCMSTKIPSSHLTSILRCRGYNIFIDSIVTIVCSCESSYMFTSSWWHSGRTGAREVNHSSPRRQSNRSGIHTISSYNTTKRKWVFICVNIDLFRLVHITSTSLPVCCTEHISDSFFYGHRKRRKVYLGIQEMISISEVYNQEPYPC